jgi:plasmid stabilization system protein ParE
MADYVFSAAAESDIRAIFLTEPDCIVIRRILHARMDFGSHL